MSKPVQQIGRKGRMELCPPIAFIPLEKATFPVGLERFPMRRFAACCLVAALTTLQAGCLALMPQQETNKGLNDVLLNAAVRAEGANDYQKAVRHFETLFARDNTNPAVARDLAKNLRYGGDPKDAAEFLTKTMATLGRKPELVLELAKAQLAASQLDDAQLTLTEARRLLPENWQVHSAWGVYNDRRGNFDQARQDYQKALDLSPNNYAVLNNLALSQALAGDIDQGITTLSKLADSKKSTSLVRQNLALLYGVKGDLEAAKRLAKKDLSQDVVKGNLSAYRDFHE